MRAHATRRLRVLAGLLGLVTLAACDVAAPAGGTTSPDGTSPSLTVLIGSGGDAQTQAVTQAVQAWSRVTGTSATVRASTNIDQDLAQAIASRRPPDIVDVGAEAFAGYAARGTLLAYGDKLGAVTDFYPALVQQFTYQGKLYCAPRDLTTLALVVNTDDWTAAGLTDAALPTTWDQLAADAKKLTTAGRVGLVVDAKYDRLGVFMAQAGGTMVSADGKTATVDSAANLTALSYVKSHLADGTFAYPSSLGAASGTDAFATGKAAMTIADNGIVADLAAADPSLGYRVVPLPAGPAGLGTLEFGTCWGITAASRHPAEAVDLVTYLTGPARQADFAATYGAMPSSQSATAAYLSAHPALRAFTDSALFASNPVTTNGAAPVVAQFDAQLKNLASSDPRAILQTVQTALQATLSAGP